MKNNHILSLLEERPLAALDESELELIKSHAGSCAECSLAYESAQISSDLLQSRASVAFEPTPFFQTRVMAAIRQRRQEGEAFGFWKMWGTARGLVASMALVAAMLTALSFMPAADRSGDAFNDVAIQEDPADLVIFGNNGSDDDMSDGQLLLDLYNNDSEGADGK